MRTPRPRAARAAGPLGALALALLLVLGLRSVTGVHVIPTESTIPDVTMAEIPTRLDASELLRPADEAVEATPVRRRRPVAPMAPAQALLATVAVVLAAGAARERWGAPPETGICSVDAPVVAGRSPPRPGIV